MPFRACNYLYKKSNQRLIRQELSPNLVILGGSWLLKMVFYKKNVTQQKNEESSWLWLFQSWQVDLNVVIFLLMCTFIVNLPF